MSKSTMKKWSEITTNPDSKWSNITATMSNGDTGSVNSQNVETLKRVIELAEAGHEFEYTVTQSGTGDRARTNLRISLPKAGQNGQAKKPYTGPRKDANKDNYWVDKKELDERIHSYHLSRDKKIESQFYVGFASPFFLEVLRQAPSSAEELKKLVKIAKQMAQEAFNCGVSVYEQVVAAEAAQRAAAEPLPVQPEPEPEPKKPVAKSAAKPVAKKAVAVEEEEFDPTVSDDWDE